MCKENHFLVGVLVGVFMSAASILIVLAFKEKPTYELASEKEVKPSIKITCIEIDGSKECDTIYIYKK